MWIYLRVQESFHLQNGNILVIFSSCCVYLKGLINGCCVRVLEEISVTVQLE